MAEFSWGKLLIALALIQALSYFIEGELIFLTIGIVAILLLLHINMPLSPITFVVLFALFLIVPRTLMWVVYFLSINIQILLILSIVLAVFGFFLHKIQANP